LLVRVLAKKPVGFKDFSVLVPQELDKTAVSQPAIFVASMVGEPRKKQTEKGANGWYMECIPCKHIGIGIYIYTHILATVPSSR